jgi:hypothetical protein
MMLIGIDYIDANRYFYATVDSQTQYEGSRLQKTLETWYETAALETVRNYAVKAEDLTDEYSSPSNIRDGTKDVIFAPSRDEISSDTSLKEKFAVYWPLQATSPLNANDSFWTRTSAGGDQIFVFCPDASLTYSVNPNQQFYIRPAVWVDGDIAFHSDEGPEFTPTPTDTLAPSPTITLSPEPTATPVPTVTFTPTPINTFTPTPTNTFTPTPTSTFTPTPLPTQTPVNTFTPTPEPTVTPTVTPSPAPAGVFRFVIDTSLYCKELYPAGGSGNEVKLQIGKHPGNNFTVDWGDGTPETTGNSHRYSVYGAYTITITGTVPGGISFYSNSTVNVYGLTEGFWRAGEYRLIEIIDPLPPTDSTNFDALFAGCVNLRKIPSNLFANNKSVTTMRSIFEHCEKLSDIPQDLFRSTPNVTDFGYAFKSCFALSAEDVVLLFGESVVPRYFNAASFDFSGGNESGALYVNFGEYNNHRAFGHSRVSSIE